MANKETETKKSDTVVAKTTAPKSNTLFVQISDDCKVIERTGVGVMISTTVGCTFAAGVVLNNLNGKYHLSSKRNKQ